MNLRLEDVERLHLGLLALAVGLAALTGGWLSPWSVLLGGGVMAVNFWLMRQLFARLVAGGAQRPGWVVVALAVAKFALFLGLLGLLFWRVPLDAISFAVGATQLLIACVVAALRPQPALS
jgi:hypothetical protein